MKRAEKVLTLGLKGKVAGNIEYQVEGVEKVKSE